MRFLASWILIGSCLGLVPTYAGQNPGLTSQAREHDVNVIITSEYEPATLDMIVGKSDTIVIGTIGAARTYIVNDEQIFTDYDVTVEQVIRRAPPGLVQGDRLVVHRLGGVMSLEGHHVVAEEDEFPRFEFQARYVLFLQRVADQPSYWVSYGPEGAFRIADDSVRQVWDGPWNREHEAVPLASFVGEVQRLAHVQP